ncbi:MAG: phosphodiesterase [Pseudomonadales bacterium]
MKTRTLLKLVVLLPLIQCLLTSHAVAEELEDSNPPMVIPERGQSQAEVAMTFGEPRRATITAGKSSIRTWHYEEFSVFFEESQVVHAVRRHRRL